MRNLLITKTIVLDHCWVCPSTEGIHQHHVVPQSCGGTNGPTVTLCGTHHSLIHTEAFRLEHERRFQGTAQQIQKLMYLTSVIHRSFAAVRGVPKPVMKVFQFSVADQHLWNAWRAANPHLTSDQKAMERALELLYQHVTPLARR